jgi:hypothetical protein
VNQGSNTERNCLGEKEIDAGTELLVAEIQGLTAGMAGLVATDKQLGLACIPQSVLYCLFSGRTRCTTYRKLVNSNVLISYASFSQGCSRCPRITMLCCHA